MPATPRHNSDFMTEFQHTTHDKAVGMRTLQSRAESDPVRSSPVRLKKTRQWLFSLLSMAAAAVRTRQSSPVKRVLPSQDEEFPREYLTLYLVYLNP